MKAQPSSPIKARLTAAKSVYIIFGIMFGIPFIISLMASLTNIHALEGALIPPLALLLIYLAFDRYELILTDTCLIYRSPFRHTRTIEISEISHVWLDYKSESYKDSRGPTMKLRIEPKTADPGKRFYINFKMFDTRKLDELFKLIDIPTSSRL